MISMQYIYIQFKKKHANNKISHLIINTEDIKNEDVNIHKI